MSRAQGKHTPRPPVIVEVDPNSPEGHQLGLSDRMQGATSPIPGGRQHISNAPTVRQDVPITAPRDEIRYDIAHGVTPGSATTRERAEMERGPNTAHSHDNPPHLEGGKERPTPVPVYIVADEDSDVLRTAAPHNFTIPGTGNDPVRICGRDLTRTEVMILNESTAQNIRIAQTLADLTNGGGALIPWPTNSYITIKTQDELYGLSTSSTAATISVIQVFERGM